MMKRKTSMKEKVVHSKSDRANVKSSNNKGFLLQTI